MVQPSETTVIFPHIPKTAGTTLLNILDRHYPAPHIYSLGLDAHAAVNAFKTLPAAERRQIRLLRGHMPFGLHADLPQPSTYITVLRDPIERVVSEYYFILRTPQHYLHDMVAKNNMSLKALLESEMALMMNDGQTRLLSGVWGKAAFGDCSPADLELARQHLSQYFSVVGLTERFDETLLLLKRTLGWRQDIFYRPQNVADNHSDRQALDAGTLALVAEVNQQDLALYAHAQVLFTAQLERQSPLFPLQVKLFQWANFRKQG